MLDLWNMFLGYITISYQRIPWILLFACPFYILFELLQRKKLIEFKQNGKINVMLKIVWGLLCSFIFVLTLFNRTRGYHDFSLIPFESYCIALGENNTEILLQNIMNIAVYIPVGFLLPYCFRYFEKTRRVLVATIICSVSIELIQGFAGIGYLEIDDTVNNVFGAVLGLVLYKVVEKVKYNVGRNNI